MDAKAIMRRLGVAAFLRMYALAVWDNNGRQFLPLFGYDGRVLAYAPALHAIETLLAFYYPDDFVEAI